MSGTNKSGVFIFDRSNNISKLESCRNVPIMLNEEQIILFNFLNIVRISRTKPSKTVEIIQRN